VYNYTTIETMIHEVHPGVAVVQHYKRCHLTSDECRQMINDAISDANIDDTVLKYRIELIRAVSQKLKRIYK